MTKPPPPPFDSPHGGVYAVPAGPAEPWVRAARESGVTAVAVDGSRVATKDALLAALASALRFPDYFRRNWDALEECLGDLSWLEAPAIAIHLGPVGALAKSDPASFATLVAIARDATAAQAQDGRRLWLLLAIEPAPGDLPRLVTPA